MKPSTKVRNWGKYLIIAFTERAELECSPEVLQHELSYVEHLKTRLNEFIDLRTSIDWELNDYWDDSANRISTKMERSEPMGIKDLDKITDLCELFLELIEEETERLTNVSLAFDEYQIEKYSPTSYNFGEI
jgi:hypothetical protein